MVNEEALCIAVSILAAALSTAGTGLFVVGIEKDNDVLQGIGVGLETLAATINEDSVTLEDVYEPYLLQQGFLTRTPRGRCVTRKTYEHLGIERLGQQEIDI